MASKNQCKKLCNILSYKGEEVRNFFMFLTLVME